MSNRTPLDVDEWRMRAELMQNRAERAEDYVRHLKQVLAATAECMRGAEVQPTGRGLEWGAVSYETWRSHWEAMTAQAQAASEDY